MTILIGLYLFIIGLAFGSFALVLVDRMHAGRDWVKGRSACEHCKHVLRPLDLIPLLSWISTRGKCRYCKKNIGVSYPLTELLCGVLFTTSYFWLPYDFTGAGVATFIIWLSALVVMTALLVYDLRWQLLPTKLVYALSFLGLFHAVFYYEVADSGLLNYLLSVLAAVAIGAGVFYIIHYVSKGKWIGDGDIRLGVAIGLFTASPAAAWLSIFLASLYGLIYGIPVLFRAKQKRTAKIPFGPFLILGLITVYLFGNAMIDWYYDAFLTF